jgi:hypothetical protein
MVLLLFSTGRLWGKLQKQVTWALQSLANAAQSNGMLILILDIQCS